jgi:hypothetical protein
MKTTKFKKWMEKFIFVQQVTKGYSVITIEWKDYLSKFQSETGITLSERQARRAKLALIKGDKLRQNLHTHTNDAGEPRGTYMQICLGKKSKYFFLLKQKAVKAFKSYSKKLIQVVGTFQHKLSRMIEPELRSYDKYNLWRYGVGEQFLLKKSYFQTEEEECY